MAKKDKILAEYREKSVHELEQLISDLRQELAQKRVNQALEDVTNHQEFKHLKRRLARALTVLNEMKLKEARSGINEEVS